MGGSRASGGGDIVGDFFERYGCISEEDVYVKLNPCVETGPDGARLYFIWPTVYRGWLDAPPAVGKTRLSSTPGIKAKLNVLCFRAR